MLEGGGLRQHARCLLAVVLPLLGGVGGSLVLGFLEKELPGVSSPLGTLGVLAGALVGGGAGLFLLVHDRKKALVHFRSLCEPDTYVHSGGTGPDFLPPLPSDSFWGRLSQLVSQALGRLGREIAHSQQARAAMEVRIRRAQEQARRAELVLGSLPHPVFILDANRQLVYANRAAQETLGWDAQAFGRPIDEIVRCEQLRSAISAGWRRNFSLPRVEEVEITLPSGARESFCCRIVRFLAGGSPQEGSGANQPPESSESPAGPVPSVKESGNGSSGTLAPVAGARSPSCGALSDVLGEKPVGPGRPCGPEESAFTGMAVILEERTDLRALRSQEAAFLSAVSHEMKTPLASIRAYAELLADSDGQDSTAREEFLTVINTQVERLQRLVQGLLDLAKIEAGILQVNKAVYSINEILEQAANVVRPAAEAKSIRLVTDLSPLFLPVCVDRDLMLQAAINLLSNAVKYTPTGGRVTLRSRLDNNEVFFQVEDTGVGLTEEECRRIFERFYRVKRNEQMAEGTGLGLALVKSIVEDLHGGRISVESTVGKGTTFTVRLSVQQVLPVN